MLIARYSVEPGGEDEVAGWLVEMAGRVQRDEEGCLVYEVGRSKDAPGEFALYECYADSDAVAAHRTTAHYREIIEGKIVPRLTNRAVELFDPVAAMRRPARA